VKPATHLVLVSNSGISGATLPRKRTAFCKREPLSLESLLNKLHLLSMTQHYFIVVHIVTITCWPRVSACVALTYMGMV
jgi:hypothetical protein